MVPYGAQSMVAPLEHVLVKRPGLAFRTAFVVPEHGFRKPVTMSIATREFNEFVALLETLGVVVHELGKENTSADLVYQYDPSLMTDRGAILLRSGKPNRRGEEDLQAEWYEANGIPIVGRIDAPGTVDGGDVFWLRPGLVCLGRSLRTNRSGIEQLSGLLEGENHVFDVPYDRGPSECLHLLSVISLILDDLAVVEAKRLPSGLFELLVDHGVRMLDIAEEEIATLACNILVVRPGVVVMLEGNSDTTAALTTLGIEVHTFQGSEICLNGSGGPTCLTRPIKRG
jgi:dimethylargininase